MKLNFQENMHFSVVKVKGFLLRGEINFAEAAARPGWWWSE
jgi:hypothetical protein